MYLRLKNIDDLEEKVVKFPAKIIEENIEDVVRTRGNALSTRKSIKQGDLLLSNTNLSFKEEEVKAPFLPQTTPSPANKNIEKEEFLQKELDKYKQLNDSPGDILISTQIKSNPEKFETPEKKIKPSTSQLDPEDQSISINKQRAD